VFSLVLAAALWLLDRKHHYGLGKISRKIEYHHLRTLFLLGAPAGASIFIEIAIFALVTTLIATFGQLPLAGHEIALQCASTTFMVPFAISAATSVRVGHAIGRMKAGLATAAEAAAGSRHHARRVGHVSGLPAGHRPPLYAERGRHRCRCAAARHRCRVSVL
jgi:MATE family multidrug resistance protein